MNKRIGDKVKDAYTKKQEQVLEELKVTKKGLTKEEAKHRLEVYGENALEAKKPKSIWSMILDQLKDKMILVLFFASILSFFLGETTEGIVILIIIAINAIISIAQEKKAADAILALKNMNAPHSVVIREGKKQEILTQDLVVGDIVFLEAGMIVPADIRLLEEHQLKIDESSLTGESITVEKDSNVLLKENTPLADRANMVLSSAIVAYGTAYGVVVGTGMNTEVGKIAHLLEDKDNLDTPLKRKLNKVGEILSLLGIGVSILVFIIGLLYGKDVISILMVAISLAISVIPEGLPATATIVMALGVERMAKKNALVKKLPAVEALGNSTVICTDKTGTLTENKMTVVKSLLYEDLREQKNTNQVSEKLIYAAVLCNNASFANEKVIGDPTEGALLTFAIKEHYDAKQIKQEHPKCYEQPFDSIRKRMSVVVKEKENFVVYTKGSIDELLDICRYARLGKETIELSPQEKEELKKYASSFAESGLRVLGYATKTLKTLPEEGSDIEQDLIFLGLTGMIDPPKKEVRHAIKSCHEAGIRVIMITGDHKLTAISIAKDLGIFRKGDLAMNGKELSQISDAELKEKIGKISVFARVTPEDKLRIVNALQEKKEIVAMTGDGVNDSPALKQADIGVAMGQMGTDVAKEAADMILLDDNFATIETAVEEGRRVYQNIQKVIQFLLAGNIAEVLVIFASILINMNSPLLAVHILFINLVTDTLPSLALGVDPISPDVMKQKPVKEGTLFQKGLVSRIAFYGIYIAFITFLAYLIGHNHSYGTGMTMAFLTLCLAQIFHSLNQTSATLSIFQKEHPRNKYLFLAMLGSLLIVLAVVLIPPLRDFFSLTGLMGREWLIVLLLSLSPIFVVEITKYFKRHQKRNS